MVMVMQAEHITFFGKMRFGSPPGRCIYCGSDGGDEGLTDEHVVPHCLAIDAYIPEASCTRCNKTTSYLEGYAGRHIFGPMRKHFRIQSRRKEIDLGVADLIVTKTDGSKETRQISRSDLPAFVALPVLPPPGLFYGRVPEPITVFEPWVWFADHLDRYVAPFLGKNDAGWELHTTVNTLRFAQMLAKIAHASVVGWLGLDAFQPFLPPLILGENNNAGYWVGGAAPPTAAGPAQPYSKDTHHHTLEIRPMSSPGKPTVLAVSIRLFLHIGTPTYWVIVGEPTPATLERLKEKGTAPML